MYIHVVHVLDIIDRFHSRDKNLDNRCYAAILVYRNVNKLVAVLRVEHGFVSNEGGE